VPYGRISEKRLQPQVFFLSLDATSGR
jgi:hypothetical protein